MSSSDLLDAWWTSWYYLSLLIFSHNSFYSFIPAILCWCIGKDGVNGIHGIHGVDGKDGRDGIPGAIGPPGSQG
jgi:hypothetical protein